jgi:CBS domain containing-hemolysin-like protein
MDPAELTINYFYLFLTIFLVILNGFFVAAEFAMVRVRGSQIEIKAKTGSRWLLAGLANLLLRRLCCTAF